MSNRTDDIMKKAGVNAISCALYDWSKAQGITNNKRVATEIHALLCDLDAVDLQLEFALCLRENLAPSDYRKVQDVLLRAAGLTRAILELYRQ